MSMQSFDMADNGGGGGGGSGDNGGNGGQQVEKDDQIPWGSQTYTPRLQEPAVSNKFWLNKGGDNPCIYPQVRKKGTSYTTYFAPCVIPNCVGYAWGRSLELGRQWNTKCQGRSDRFGNPPVMWRSSTWQKKWAHGGAPRLGALAIWYSKNGKYENGKPVQGHIAVVEGLHYNGNGKLDYFLISHSGYPTEGNHWGQPPKWDRWGTKKIYVKDNFKYSSTYPFMGFYYPPYVAMFSTDASGDYAYGDDANAYCGLATMTVYVKDPETGEWHPVQGTGNVTYDPDHPGIPTGEGSPLPPPVEPAYKAGSSVQVKGIGNSSKLGTGSEVSCIGATYQIKSIHPGFPFMYRIGTDKRGIGYFKETDLEAV